MDNNATLIHVEHLKKSFESKRPNLTSSLKKSETVKVYAVDDVSFDLQQGEILGLIGESGCGKSTTARLLLKLINPDAGKFCFKGQDITYLAGAALGEYRKSAQIIFQDPYEYLNPRMNVLDCIAEPLVINNMVKSRAEKEEWVSKYLDMVGMSPAQSYLYRYPHEMSGGQRQRIAIARALVMQPQFVVADEPTSMLDVSVRVGILNLLKDMKQSLGVAMLFITHDLSTAGYMCDRIAVMYKGRIVEIGSKDHILFEPRHPYTKALVSVALTLKDFLFDQNELIKEGEVDSFEKITACPFEKRCINYCAECENPQNSQLQQVSPGHYVACWRC